MKPSGFLTSVLVSLALMCSAARADDSLIPLTHKKLLGWWGGGDTNDLNCILAFGGKQAKIHPFQANKHLSTVNAWYRVGPGDRVTLGINGEATALVDGKLQLKLTRQYDHIVVLREAMLQRMPQPNPKESRK